MSLETEQIALWHDEQELTMHNAARCKKALLDSLKNKSGLTLDLSQVSKFDSAGIQLILLAKREARQANLDFRISAVSDGVARTLNVIGLYDHLVNNGSLYVRR